MCVCMCSFHLNTEFFFFGSKIVRSQIMHRMDFLIHVFLLYNFQVYSIKIQHLHILQNDHHKSRHGIFNI